MHNGVEDVFSDFHLLDMQEKQANIMKQEI
jgi:hypothetical protein